MVTAAASIATKTPAANAADSASNVVVSSPMGSRIDLESFADFFAIEHAHDHQRQAKSKQDRKENLLRIHDAHPHEDNPASRSDLATL